jgi:putative sterol carrier protein
MSHSAFRRCGLEKLTEVELESLSAWIDAEIDSATAGAPSFRVANADSPAGSATTGTMAPTDSDSEQLVEQIVSTGARLRDPHAFSNRPCVIQFYLKGYATAAFFWRIHADTVMVEAGTHANPDAILSLGPSDYADLIAGELDAQEAFTEERLEVSGDVIWAVRLSHALRKVPPSPPNA